ncbi:MAG: hypothetical protein IKD61_01585, partial [Oscillospiraceae bacterium]|nr:hypothetical protein [Oscillospiraceae bacterium]
MKNWQKQVPPYEGADAYVYFAFADGDVGRVWPIMRTLLRRGVRVWYCTGPAGSAEELLHRQERSRGAALTLLYLTDAAVADKDSKSRILVNQNRGQSILCLDPDGVDRRLSMGLREDVPHLALQSCRSAEDLEDALIRAEGFTQELFGEPTAVEQDKLLGRLSLGISLLAAALLLLAFAGYRHFGWFRPNYADEITIRDEVILDAARQAAGGGALTGEKAA